MSNFDLYQTNVDLKIVNTFLLRPMSEISERWYFMFKTAGGGGGFKLSLWEGRSRKENNFNIRCTYHCPWSSKALWYLKKSPPIPTHRQTVRRLAYIPC